MVRSQTYRQKKYEVKIDADVIRSRFAGLKPIMVEQTAAKFTDLAANETNVKAVIEPLGIPTIQIPFYLNYARELYSLTQRFSGKTLENEAKLLGSKWKARGLAEDTLIKIAAQFGITLTPPL
jgi:hypothetical protein